MIFVPFFEPMDLWKRRGINEEEEKVAIRKKERKKERKKGIVKSKKDKKCNGLFVGRPQ